MQSKTVSKAGGVTIPKQVRAELGIFGGHTVDLEVKDGGVFIKKHTRTCKLCGATGNILTHKGLEVCKNCVEEMKEAFNVE